MQHILRQAQTRFVFGALLLLILALNPLFAEETLSETDRQAIQNIIQSQLDAFGADDAEVAFSFASPSIQSKFGDSETFMVMVKTGYPPVYRNRAVFFKDIVSFSGGFAQQVLILDTENKPVMAVYPMEKQPDGSWRIDGCMLKPAEAQAL